MSAPIRGLGFQSSNRGLRLLAQHDPAAARPLPQLTGMTTPSAQPGVQAEYLTADEVGALLRLSAKTVYRLAKGDPTFPALKLGGTVRFPRERLLRWLWDREQGRPRMRRQVASAVKAAPEQRAGSG